MPTIRGFGIEDFIKYKPLVNTIAISFASKLGRQYDQQLYAKLPDVYTRYLNHLVILADDIPINKPNPEYQLFTNKDAQNVIDFVNKYPNNDIVIHCNAGVSRTGTLVRFLANHYNYHIMGQQNFVTNPLINNSLQQVYKKNQQNIYKGNEIMNETMIPIAMGIYLIISLILSIAIIMVLLIQDKFTEDTIKIGFITGFIGSLVFLPILIWTIN